jgi:hypothetical protein
MRTALLLSVVWLGALAASANAQSAVYEGNDTGGIIPWSCENEAMALHIAAAYCARWDKYPRITSVHRQYGDYIGFNCLWSPYAAPYGLPPVPTRSACYDRPPLVITK